MMFNLGDVNQFQKLDEKRVLRRCRYTEDQFHVISTITTANTNVADKRGKF